MRIIARSTLRGFIDTLKGKKERAAVASAPRAWLQETERAEWRNAADVKTSYVSASIIDAGRAVFNIKGNSYRLVASINYKRGIVFVKWLGSHAEYDKIDVRTIQYGDQAYQKRTGSSAGTGRD